MARDNITWGEERIAAELLLKFGFESRRTRSAGTWVAGLLEAGAVAPGSDGPPSCGIMPGPS